MKTSLSLTVLSLFFPASLLLADPEILTEGNAIDLEFRIGQSLRFTGAGYTRWRNVSSMTLDGPEYSYYMQTNKPDLKSSMGEAAFEYRSVPWLGVGLSIGVEEYKYENLPLLSNKSYGAIVLYDFMKNGIPDSEEKKIAFRDRIQLAEDLRLIHSSGSALTQPSAKMEITLHLPIKGRPMEPRLRVYAGGGPDFLTVGFSSGTRLYLKNRNLFLTTEVNYQTFMSASSTGFINLTNFPTKMPVGIVRETSVRIGTGYSFNSYED